MVTLAKKKTASLLSRRSEKLSGWLSGWLLSKLKTTNYFAPVAS